MSHTFRDATVLRACTNSRDYANDRGRTEEGKGFTSRITSAREGQTKVRVKGNGYARYICGSITERNNGENYR